jgi:phage/plasmid-associated DNA primase
MDIVFDSELKARRLRGLLMDFLIPMSSRYISRASALDSSSTVGGARLMFERLISDVVSELPLASYVKDNNPDYFSQVRIFNGEYYERISMTLVVETIYGGWLFDHCKMNHKFYSKFDKACYKTLKRSLEVRRLEPRLDLMCFKNGVVDFKDVGVKSNKDALRPFSPEYHCIKQYDFKWNPKAECPIWNKFLGIPSFEGQDPEEIDGVLPERHKRVVLQKFLGGGFIDRRKVKFEYLMILYGTGANGKSVVKDVLDGIFGKEEVFPNLQFSSLTKEGFDGFNSRRAIEGCRFAYCTEMSPSEFRRPELVKAAASGESMAARGIGENTKPVVDIPIFMCNSNYDWGEVELIPKDSPNDESMSRRVLLLNFDKRVPENKRDPELSEKLLKEREGIFMWMVRGYKRLKRDKWKIKDSLFGRVEKVRHSANNSSVIVNGKKVHGSIIEYTRFKSISPIMDEEHGHAVLVSSTDIYENYKKFCINNGIASYVKSAHKLSLDFGTLGYSKRVGFGANNCNGYIMYWDKPYSTMIFQNEVPSIEKTLDLEAVLGNEVLDDDWDEEEFIND